MRLSGFVEENLVTHAGCARSILQNLHYRSSATPKLKILDLSRGDRTDRKS